MTHRGVPGDPGNATRKAIHLGLSLVAAAVVWLLPPLPAATVLAGTTLVALSVELARRISPAIARVFEERLAGMLKDGEPGRLTGATTLALGFTAAAVTLPGTPALAGVLFAGVGDPAAALIGRRWGRLRYPGGKSVAGSAAFVVVAWGLGLALGLGTGTALLAGLVAAGAEAPTLRIDDNLYLPLGGAVAVAVAGWATGM